MPSWTVEITRERIPHLRTQLEWALQHQNRRFANSMRTASRKIIIGLGILGLALIALAGALDPRQFQAFPGFYAAMSAVFVVVIVIAFTKKKMATKLGLRGAARGLARQAERTYAKVAAQAPYVVEYSLEGANVRARADKLGVDRTTELRARRLVCVTPDVLVMFRWRRSLVPMRFIYCSDDDARRALLAACASHAVETVEISGPSDGYADPIPQAKARA
jgi:hypothetical protein